MTNTYEYTREFDFNDRDFHKIRRLLYAHAGISLSEVKKNMVYSRITRRLRARRLDNFGEYLEQLENDSVEFEEFVNALTTNLTSFFREAHHFPILASLLKERRAAGDDLTVWSSACSTGEEVYTIAMTAIEALGKAPRIRILGTDLDTRAVRTADLGIYTMEQVQSLGAERLQRFFLKGTGDKEGYVRVRPEVRSLVRFRPMNLMEPGWPLRGPFQAIFCRNTMIYFDRTTQRRLLERFVPLLHPEGRLFAGHSESLGHSADLLRGQGRSVYRLAGRDPGDSGS